MLSGERGEGCPTVSKVLSRATPALFKKTSPSTFFTMLTFSQILNIYLQWMTALSPAIVCKVKSDQPMYGKSSCQYNHDMAPSCTLIIPHRLSIIAQFSCQSQHIIWKSQRGIEAGVRERGSDSDKLCVPAWCTCVLSVRLRCRQCLWSQYMFGAFRRSCFHFCDSTAVCERKGRIGKRECAAVALCWRFKKPGSRVGGHVIN